MTEHRLPNDTSQGVLSGEARLFLPAPSCVIEARYRPPVMMLGRSEYAKPVRLDLPVGWRGGGVRQLDVVFLMDESGSMYGPAGDPTGVRRAVALSVVDLLHERSDDPQTEPTSGRRPLGDDSAERARASAHRCAPPPHHRTCP